MAESEGSLHGSLSLVIPAHNESENIAKVIRASIDTLAALAPEWEIVLVDDGSSDDTVRVARTAMGSGAERLRVIRHEGKLGYGITVADGLRAARMEYIAFMDGDGQFDPADLKTLAGLMDSADLAAGWRRRRADPGYRLMIAGVFMGAGVWLHLTESHAHLHRHPPRRCSPPQWGVTSPGGCAQDGSASIPTKSSSVTQLMAFWRGHSPR